MVEDAIEDLIGLALEFKQTGKSSFHIYFRNYFKFLTLL